MDVQHIPTRSASLVRSSPIDIYIHTHKYICSGFGKWGYPKSSILMGFSVYIYILYKPSVFGYHILGNIPTYIYIHTHTYAYIHIHTYTYIYIDIYIYTYIDIYISIYIYIAYIYTIYYIHMILPSGPNISQEVHSLYHLNMGCFMVFHYCFMVKLYIIDHYGI